MIYFDICYPDLKCFELRGFEYPSDMTAQEIVTYFKEVFASIVGDKKAIVVEKFFYATSTATISFSPLTSSALVFNYNFEEIEVN